MRYLLIALVLAAWSGCKSGEPEATPQPEATKVPSKAAAGDPCVQSADCAGGLTCYDEEKRCQTPKYIKEMAETQVVQAKAKAAVLRLNKLEKKREAMVAANVLAKEKCRGPRSSCKSMGICVARADSCWVAASTNEDCTITPHGDRRWIPCKQGYCTAKDGICVAASDADCAKGHCKLLGACTAKDGKCIAASDADCREKSTKCKSSGTCVARNGVCVASSDQDCKQSDTCEFSGACVSEHGACVAASNADCKRSKYCKRWGWCKLEHGRCI